MSKLGNLLIGSVIRQSPSKIRMAKRAKDICSSFDMLTDIVGFSECELNTVTQVYGLLTRKSLRFQSGKWIKIILYCS